MDPVPVVVVPEGQSSQGDKASTALYFPTGQATHVVPSVSVPWPAGHVAENNLGLDTLTHANCNFLEKSVI